MNTMWAVFKRVRVTCRSMLLGGLLFCSCNQDPIFYGISLEVEPVDPRLVGMPTRIVAVEDSLYVASKFSSAIHCYEGASGWKEVPKRPGGAILELAATETQLYALTGEPGSTALYALSVSDTNADWKQITSNYGNIQSIYGAGDRLFAGAMIDTSTFGMFYDNAGKLEALSGGSGFLQGAAVYAGTYYLAGTGIYSLEGTSLTLVSDTAGITVVGLLQVGDGILGVGDGKILYGPSGGFTVEDKGVTFTGALALWGKKGKEAKTLLLLGIQGSSTSTTHGYRELVLKEDSLDPGDMSLKTPGNNPEASSISNYDKYSSSLGKHPVMALFQAPDGILFAGTTKNGLWSYRNEQWNAEP
ncbi:MAG: hypothetical protein LBD93_00185 [Treponema sp.]|jgi:hypothetical protein|nr:hypothetical protein [Treponema sp.]